MFSFLLKNQNLSACVLNLDMLFWKDEGSARLCNSSWCTHAMFDVSFLSFLFMYSLKSYVIHQASWQVLPHVGRITWCFAELKSWLFYTQSILRMSNCLIYKVLFLMYHYFEAREFYNAIRVFIAAYVWMTGFGNFSYYYIRKDFSLGRFAQVCELSGLLLVLISVYNQ